MGKHGAVFTSRVFSLQIKGSVTHPVVVRPRQLQRAVQAPSDSDAAAVQPKQVHRNAVTEMIENITFLHCPEDRHVNVRVPVVVRLGAVLTAGAFVVHFSILWLMQVAGLELSPGARRGGWINTLFPAVRCRCPGGSIPPYLEVDVSGLNIGDSVRLEDLQLPPGVHVLEKALDMPVCKMRGTSGGGGQ